MQNENISWDAIYKENEGAKYPNEDIIRFIARNFYGVKNRKNIKILELGCGTGNNIWFLAREGFDAYGIDISEIAISRAKERLSKENLSANLQVGNIININYPDNYFDAVIDGATIESNPIDDMERIINDTYRVLKTNGKFYSLMISTDSSGYKRGGRIEENDTFRDIEFGHIKRKGRLHFFEEREIYTLLCRGGFVDINIGYTQRSFNNMNEVIKYWLVEAQKVK